MRHTWALYLTMALVCEGAVGWSAEAPASSAAGALAAKPAPNEARIAFADHGAIDNWIVENDRTLYIQSQSRKWYRATLFNPCFDLPFQDRIGFESNPDGSFDRFSSIRVRGQVCRLSSLVEAADPTKKTKKPVEGTHPASAAKP